MLNMIKHVKEWPQHVETTNIALVNRCAYVCMTLFCFANMLNAQAQLAKNSALHESDVRHSNYNYAPLDTSWQPLFNGKDLSGWTAKFTGYPVGENIKNTFRVEDGLLTVSYDQWDSFENDAFGHLFTEHAYTHYKIRMEYRFVGQQVTNAPEYQWAYRNNGVMLHTPPAEYMALNQAFPISAESQLLGGNGTDERSTGNFCSPSTHIVKNGNMIKDHCVNSSSPTFHGDQWVVFEVEVNKNGAVKHFINGELVFAYDQIQVDPNDEYGKIWLAEGRPLVLTGGHIAVQAETHPTQFKSIAIRALD